MYSLDTPLSAVKGIGPSTAIKLAKRDLNTVLDLLLFLPLRYEDRSHQRTINQLVVDDLVTITAEVITTGNYYKGRRSIQSATVKDHTGKLKLMWFNNHWIIDKLVKGNRYLISGKLNDRGTMVQPVVEDVKEDSIHTNRLVPIYSAVPEIKQGTFRRLLKHIVDNLHKVKDPLDQLLTSSNIYMFQASLNQLHFPDQAENVINARRRLALEELLILMRHSQEIKENWKKQKGVYQLTHPDPTIPSSVPYELTSAQTKAYSQILADLSQSQPMNRLLIGDVGSGKTVVVGLAARQMIKHGHSVALVAPTQILATQHVETLTKLFPDLKIELVMGGAKKKKEKRNLTPTPTLFVGTHALINRLSVLQPGLIIFDEQHRFGVKQRSFEPADNVPMPHVLTMTATPIPRSLMLTIFSHLDVSVIDEMPKGRQPVKTWVVPETKRLESYNWVFQQITDQPQTLVIFVCPFINRSEKDEFDQVASAKEKFDELTEYLEKTKQKNLTTVLLHGKLPKEEKEQVTEQLLNKQVNLLVTTPVIEVGLDVPTASVIVIEGAERFGLASLHQLRGRVGRAGQQAYCLLFTSQSTATNNQRLKEFSESHNGLKLAELDLKRRGGGDLFGTHQHGLESLRFAEWTDLELITTARQVYEEIDKTKLEWQPLFEVSNNTDDLPSAN